MDYNTRIEELLDDMSVFEDWTEKYEFIISLGRKLPAMPEKYRKNSNLIKGCQSRVWVGTEMDDGKLIIHADSDSLITKGLIALFIRLLSGLTPAEVLAAVHGTDVELPVSLALCLSLTISEIRGLRASDFDGEAVTVRQVLEDLTQEDLMEIASEFMTNAESWASDLAGSDVDVTDMFM